MTDTFRALCQELIDEIDAKAYGIKSLPSSVAIDRARAELAKPEPQGPSDQELWELYDEKGGAPEDFAWYANYARAALARWGRPAIEPENNND